MKDEFITGFNEAAKANQESYIVGLESQNKTVGQVSQFLAYGFCRWCQQPKEIGTFLLMNLDTVEGVCEPCAVKINGTVRPAFGFEVVAVRGSE